MRPMIAAVSLALAAFCVYGILATFEPGPRAIPFRIGYSVGGVLCLAAALSAFVIKKK